MGKIIELNLGTKKRYEVKNQSEDRYRKVISLEVFDIQEQVSKILEFDSKWFYENIKL